MDDIDGHTSAFADLDGLFYRIENTEPFVTYVSGVNAVVFAHNLAQLDEVIRRRQRPRWHHQRRGQAESTVVHGFADQFFHLLQLGRSGPREGTAHDALPDVSLADVGGDIDGDARPFGRG